jgi:hypothetical protein
MFIRDCHDGGIYYNQHQIAYVALEEPPTPESLRVLMAETYKQPVYHVYITGYNALTERQYNETKQQEKINKEQAILNRHYHCECILL